MQMISGSCAERRQKLQDGVWIDPEGDSEEPTSSEKGSECASAPFDHGMQ